MAHIVLERRSPSYSPKALYRLLEVSLQRRELPHRRGPIWGVPIKKDDSVWGSILGPAFF